MKNSPANIRYFVIALLLLLGGGTLRAEEQQFIYTVGTSNPVTKDTTQIYIAFQSEDPDLLGKRKFAVCRKLGKADANTQFARVAVVSPQTNTKNIRILLNRSLHIEENLDTLDVHVSGLFGDVLPAEDMPVEEKIAFLIQAAKTNPETYETLYLLGRMHPAVNLCLGTAFTEKLDNGIYTYEIRDSGTLNVLGRVTVDTSSPVVLPAPYAPQEVVPMQKAEDWTPESQLVPSAKGHLKVCLRWGVPDDLRRLGLLHFGYNVYRVPNAVATAKGWDAQSPKAGTLAEATVTGDAQLINEVPVLIDQVMTADEAADPQDHSTVFIIDANRDGETPFANGDKYYYFVSARDPLGRDGDYSIGSQVVISDRLPPASPKKISVENCFSYATGKEHHALKVRWQAPEPKDEEEITRFYIYRWPNINQMQLSETNPALNRIGVVDANDKGKYEFIDDGSMTTFTGSNGEELIDAEVDPKHPAGASDYGKTFWYTVRAVDDAAGGGNVSGSSSPAFGVLRDRSFEGRPSSTFSVVDENITVSPVSSNTEGIEEPDTNLYLYYNFANIATSSVVEWTEFWLGTQADGPQIQLGERLQMGEQNSASTEGKIAKETAIANPYLFCIAKGSEVEGRGGLLLSQTVFNLKSERLFVGFMSLYDLRHTELDPADPNHFSVSLSGGTIFPLRLTLGLAEGTAEYKVYRRLDDGPLIMLEQGLAAEEQEDVVVEDTTLILHDGLVSYYGQLFDTNGNPGPMVLLQTVEMRGRTPMEAPRLLPIVPAGTPQEPRARLRWFAPAHGLEKFTLSLFVETGQAPENLSSYLTMVSYQDVGNVYAHYYTGRIGVDFKPSQLSDTVVVKDNSYFELEVPVALGKKHHFSIGSVSLYGRFSPQSAEQTFTWKQTGGEQTGGVNGGDDGSGTVNDPSLLPWPVRAMPEEALFPDQIFPRLLLQFISYNETQGVFLRIGDVPGLPKKPGDPPWLQGDTNPEDFVYTNQQQGLSLMPFVLYRKQLASTASPHPRANVYQVSPKIEQIPHEYIDPDGTLIRDRFFYTFDGANKLSGTTGLHLKDTQPLIRGAKYQYTVVLFDKKTGEPTHSIVLPAIDIPDAE